MFHKQTRIPDPDSFDGSSIVTFSQFRCKAREFVLGSLPFADACSLKGVRLASTLLKGAAYDWYNATQPFENCDDLFHKLAVRFGVFHQEDLARAALDTLTSKPWGSQDYMAYHNKFQSLVVWTPTIDKKSLKTAFLKPVNQAIKDFISHYEVDTWEEAHRMIAAWLTRKGLINQHKVPSTFLQQHDTPSTATPMEIGAAPAAPARLPHTTNYGNQTAAEFWKTKKCLACGLLGHSKNYKGCTKHPEYKPRTARTAAVEAPAPTAPPTYAAAAAAAPPAMPAGAAATTSTAAAAASAAAAELQALREEVAVLRMAINE